MRLLTVTDIAIAFLAASATAHVPFDDACVYLAKVPPTPMALVSPNVPTLADIMSWDDAPSIRMPGFPSADHAWWIRYCLPMEVMP